MLGYNPRYNMSEDAPNSEQQPEDLPDNFPAIEDLNLHVIRRDDNREASTAAVARHNVWVEKNEKGVWSPPRAGDLVLVRQFELDKQHGRKLEPRWGPPKLLREVLTNGVTGWVSDVYGLLPAKKYHLDDLKVYVPRNDEVYPPLPPRTVEIERQAMALAGFPGQRAVDLSFY